MQVSHQGQTVARGGKRKALLAIVVVGAVVVGVYAAVAAWGRARVEGSSPEERIKSICRLADRRPRGAGDAIAEAATRDPDTSVRRAALVGLSRFAKPRYRSVVEACTRDATADVRASAATTLGAYSDEAAADRLGEILSSDPDPSVRLAAVAGLARNTDSRAIVWLMEAAEKDASPHVQVAAITELYWKFGMQYLGARPDGTERWQHEVQFRAEWLKDFPRVQEAYRKARRPLVQRPEYYRPPISEPDPRAAGPTK